MNSMLSAEFDSLSSGMKALVYSPAANFGNKRVVVYLHGSGGFGTGLAGLFQFPDLPSLLRDGMSLTSTVLVPSCHEGEYWRPEIISAFLDDFEHSNGVGGVRYDVVGYSRGGQVHCILLRPPQNGFGQSLPSQQDPPTTSFPRSPPSPHCLFMARRTRAYPPMNHDGCIKAYARLAASVN
jgi:hypothetical protein